MEYRVIKPGDMKPEPPAEPEPEGTLVLWTTSRAAHELGVNVKTIRRAFERGEVPGHPVLGLDDKIAYWICMPEQLKGYIKKGPGRPVKEQE